LITLELKREYEKQMRPLKIGETPLVRAQKLEKRLGIRKLNLKLEGENPSGTHKDRAALIHCLDARMKGFTTLTAVSCGNYGAALAYVADKLNMGAKIYIPSGFAAPRRGEIQALGGEVVSVDGDYEAALRKSAADAVKKHWYDANPGGGNKELCSFAYAFIAKEIAESLGCSPDWVSVPVGNGAVMSGIWQGFRGMSMKPKMLGCSNNNSAIYGLVCGAKVRVDVPGYHETELNEPLCGNFLTDGEEAIAAITESNGSAIEVPDEDLLKAAALIAQEEGLDILPASAGAVWGISKLDSKNHLFVAVLTGRGHPGRAK
jgi:threonine synthase